MKESIVWLLVIFALIGAGLYLVYLPVPASSAAPSGSVTFYCGDDHTIAARFAGRSVSLALSDGEYYTLRQAAVGSGIRYEASTTNNSSIAFTSDGTYASFMNTASSSDTQYETCTAARVTATNGVSLYADQAKTFTFTFPSDFAVAGVPAGYGLSWAENATTTGMELARIDVPQSFEPGTNFVRAWFTVGVSSAPAGLATCFENTSGLPSATATPVTIHGTTYTKLQTVDAAAGNRYDTTSYRAVHDHACYAIEYTIHYSALENYPPGAVQAFDQQKVQSALESMVQSFTFTS